MKILHQTLSKFQNWTLRTKVCTKYWTCSRKDIEMRRKNCKEIQENRKWENRDGWSFWPISLEMTYEWWWFFILIFVSFPRLHAIGQYVVHLLQEQLFCILRTRSCPALHIFICLPRRLLALDRCRILILGFI